MSVPRQCPVTVSNHISHYTTEPYSPLLILLAEKTQDFSCPSSVQGKDSMNRMDCLISPSIVLTPLIHQNKMKKIEWLRKTELKMRNCFLIKLMCQIHLPLCKLESVALQETVSYLPLSFNITFAEAHLVEDHSQAICLWPLPYHHPCALSSYSYITARNLHIWLNCIFIES